MMSIFNPLVKLFSFFLLSLFCSPIVSAQVRDVTIKGNIKLFNAYERDLDECFFHYKDVLSSESRIIPIMRDSAGNFSVSFQLDTYQQIYFGKLIKIDGRTIYNTGMILFSFFARPGQKMQLMFTEKPFKLVFGGDFSIENSQYQIYTREQQQGVKNIWDGIENRKLTPEQANTLALNAYHEQLKFSEHYFKTHATSSFIKQQVYFDALYAAQEAAIELNLLSGNGVTQNSIADFYGAMNSSSARYRDGTVANLNSSFDPNASLKNAGALGNGRYIDFVGAYFKVFQRNIKTADTQSISYKDMARYLLKKYPDLKQEEKSLLAQYTDHEKEHSNEQNKAIAALTNSYATEYLQTMDLKSELGKYLAIKDPVIRELGATMYLYKKLNLNEIEYIETSIDDYKKGVQNFRLKEKFLGTYQQQLDRLHHSKMPPLAILNPVPSFTGPDLLGKILEKYKGKVIYLDLWATWCGPCIAGMESSQKLKEYLKSKDIIFLYLCLNSPNEQGWKNMIAAKKIEGENYFLDKEQSILVGKSLNVTSIPHYAIIDKNGNLADQKAPAPGNAKTIKILKDLLQN